MNEICETCEHYKDEECSKGLVLAQDDCAAYYPYNDET
jgi:hypothetical protein